MKVIVDLCLIPIGVGISLGKYIKECEKILIKSKLKYSLHANGTNIEGEWDLVLDTIKKCHETIHEFGAPRIHTNLKIGTRIDKDQTMEDKIQSLKKL